MQYTLIIYSVLFIFLGVKNFRLALGLFIISLPTYLIRFEIFSLPTTLLEINFGILFLVWLIKYAHADLPRITYHITRNKFLFSCFFVFLIASVAGIFVSDMWYYSFGQWRAYFLEPVLVFAMLVGRTANAPHPALSLGERVFPLPPTGEGWDEGSPLAPHDLVWFLLLSTISISVVAIIQKLTGALYPPSLWNDQTFGRATSFFTSPNAVGLYLAPIIMLSVAKITKLFSLNSLVVALAMVALLFSQSLGAIIALVIGLLVFAYFVGYKKIALTGILIAIILAVLPPTQHLLINKSKSLDNRLVLWSHTKTFLTASPKNFILGAGIRQYFRKVEKPFYNPAELERLIYPHNIFLNFWTEIGLFGALSFVGIFYFLLATSYKIHRSNRLLGAALLSTLVVVLAHGLIDAPYFKNDLAMLFWVIAIIIIKK